MKYSHTFIILHGFTMNKEDMKYYVDKFKDLLNREGGVNIKFIIPEYSKIPITIYNGVKYNSWYDYLTGKCDSEPLINDKQLIKNRNRIHKLIHKEIKYYKGDSSKIFICGYSQGCCMAIDIGITFPHILGGVIGFKGHPITKSINDFKTQQKIWCCHGINDKTIYYKYAKKNYDILKLKNPSLKLLSHHNNHSMQKGIVEEMRSIRQWIDI